MNTSQYYTYILSNLAYIYEVILPWIQDKYLGKRIMLRCFKKNVIIFCCFIFMASTLNRTLKECNIEISDLKYLHIIYRPIPQEHYRC